MPIDMLSWSALPNVSALKRTSHEKQQSGRDKLDSGFMVLDETVMTE